MKVEDRPIDKEILDSCEKIKDSLVNLWDARYDRIRVAHKQDTISEGKYWNNGKFMPALRDFIRNNPSPRGLPANSRFGLFFRVGGFDDFEFEDVATNVRMLEQNAMQIILNISVYFD